MHPQMSQPQYIPNDFGLFPSPSLHPHATSILPHPTQPLSFHSYDPPNYPQDPSAQFDMSKPINQFQYMPSPLHNESQQEEQRQQYQQNPHSGPSVNNFMLSSYPMNMYPTPELRRHQPSNSISGDESLPTPVAGRGSALRVPKFDRTYTDALEDELYDESSTSLAVNSQNHASRNATPNFAFPCINQYPDPVYMDKTISHDGNAVQQRHQHGHQLNTSKSVSANMYSQSNPTYHPLGDRNHQQLSISAVADSVRNLQAPNRTTVSPREAFLDYPDNADFREKTLFSNSASPYLHGHEGADISIRQESENSLSNDEEYHDSDGFDNSISLRSVPYVIPESHSHLRPTSLPISSRSNSTSTRKSGLLSGGTSVESSSSSDSEYDPTPASGRRASRSGGRSATLSKTFSCPDCGKRFDKAQPLQTHRRHLHGKGTGPPNLSNQKFSNASHRCDWVDPTTGKLCNTVFSRP